MSLLCRPGRLVAGGLSRALSLAVPRAGRRHQDKLEVPVDKTGIIIGKQRASVRYPKEGVSDKAYPIHVLWDRPVYMQTCNAEISGDVGGLESLGLDRVDPAAPPVRLEGSPALAAASPEVRRVLSLDFARRRDFLDKLSQEVVRAVQRHPRDFGSLEVRITTLTVRIRSMQHALIQQWPYKNQPMKHSLTHRVSARRELLRRLREQDYKRYEWLLEKLNLLYKPMPHDTGPGVLGVKENVERKKSIQRLTDLWCDELQKHRLGAYRRKQEAAQPEFLRRKAETLREILDTEIELDVPRTVTEEEIASCVERAVELEARQAGEPEEQEDYQVYRQEIVREENIFVR